MGVVAGIVRQILRTLFFEGRVYVIQVLDDFFDSFICFRPGSNFFKY